MKTTSLTHEEISERAHQIWEEHGRPEGQETEHWLQAEQELAQQIDKAKGRRPKASVNGSSKC